jgi:hypothetical protein
MGDLWGCLSEARKNSPSAALAHCDCQGGEELQNVCKVRGPIKHISQQSAVRSRPLSEVSTKESHTGQRLSNAARQTLDDRTKAQIQELIVEPEQTLRGIDA